MKKNNLKHVSILRSKLINISLIGLIILAGCSKKDITPPPPPPAGPTLTITGFSPASGMPGSSVNITGTAFSTTPASNEVNFTGGTAVVTAATTTSLTVTVPATASNGKISVKVAGVTVTSATDFTVLPAPPSVSISSFSPDAGGAGTTVTIYGKGFSTTAASNNVTFNGTAAVVSSATATSITTTAPAGATTGKITVKVGADIATSATDYVLTAGTHRVLQSMVIDYNGLFLNDSIYYTYDGAFRASTCNFVTTATNYVANITFTSSGALAQVSIPNFQNSPYTVYSGTIAGKPDNISYYSGGLQDYSTHTYSPTLISSASYYIDGLGNPVFNGEGRKFISGGNIDSTKSVGQTYNQSFKYDNKKNFWKLLGFYKPLFKGVFPEGTLGFFCTQNENNIITYSDTNPANPFSINSVYIYDAEGYPLKIVNTATNGNKFTTTLKYLFL